MSIEHVFAGCVHYSDDASHDCRFHHDADMDSWCRYCLGDEVEWLRSVLIDAEGYAISHGGRPAARGDIQRERPAG